MLKILRLLTLTSLLACASVGARAAVIAEANFANSFGTDNAFSIFNSTTLGITSATLTTTNLTSVWDDNLPGQASVSFLINAGSSSTGVSHAFLDPEAGSIADFNGFYSLALSFADFNPGELFIFGADIDGTPINSGALAGNLVIDLIFGDGSTASASYALVAGNLIRAVAEPVAAVPEPATLSLLCLGLLALTVQRRRRI